MFRDGIADKEALLLEAVQTETWVVTFAELLSS